MKIETTEKKLVEAIKLSFSEVGINDEDLVLRIVKKVSENDSCPECGSKEIKTTDYGNQCGKCFLFL